MSAPWNLRTTLLSAAFKFIRNGSFDTAANLASVSLTSGSPTLTCTSTTGVVAGAKITGTGIPAMTTVLSITDATHLVMSANASSDESTESGVTYQNPIGFTYAPLTTSTNFSTLGHAKSAAVTADGTQVPIRSATQGIYAHRMTIIQPHGGSISAPMDELSSIGFESFMQLGGGALTIGTGSQPFVMNAPPTGWLLCQAFDQTQTKTIELLLYGELFFAPCPIEEGKYGQALTFKTIFNPLNLATLSALANDAAWAS
jgi:hypothetical protein